MVCAIDSPVAQADDSYRMQIHPREVAGTWEVSHGYFKRAITLLEIAAAKSHRTSRDYGPIMNNLCVAYTLSGDFGRARANCDRAVDFSYPPGLAMNNRGVLQALSGDLVAAAADFAAAKGRNESVEAAHYNSKRLDELVSEVTRTSPATAATDPMT